MTEQTLRQAMPLLARHEGVWDGYYRFYDPDGNKIDEHRSRLLCRFETDDLYHQTNFYYWADGRKDLRDFPGEYDPATGRMMFSGVIEGWAAELRQDDFARTVMLSWDRPEEKMNLYEMIQLSDCGTRRSRVWHWFRDDRLFQRTLVDERRIDVDWRKYENSAELGYGDIAQFAD
ncbi:MAG: DUF3598 domain-containing protein [Gammaproteobacteria bacterium AqS3]|nr:DUF3598 domain-containing protein [Gammaproteobacteria bacterium AqS3]